MKMKILAFTLVIGAVLLFSCQRNESGQTTYISTFSESASVSPGTITSGFALVVNTGFYVLSGNDAGDEKTKTKWSAQVPLGEKLTLGNTRRMTLESDNKVYEFTEVRRQNGNEGYILTWQVAEGERLAVVVDEKTNLFRSPKTVDVSGVILTRRSVVIYYPETEDNGFVEVRGYDIGRREYVNPNNSFVRLSSLSRRDSDIQAAIHLQTALSLTAANQSVRREALLETALFDYPDSVFYNEIFEIANPNTSGVIINDTAVEMEE